MKVLAVDDNAMLWERLLCLLGTAQPPELTLAQSLGEAREALACSTPDLLVLDIQLPDGNGLDLLPEVRRSHPGLPIAMFSNHPEFRRHALTHGADRFFDKSLDFPELLAMLAGDLPRRAGERSGD